MPLSEHALATIRTFIQVLGFVGLGSAAGYGIYWLRQEQTQEQEQQTNIYVGPFGPDNVEVEEDQED